LLRLDLTIDLNPTRHIRQTVSETRRKPQSRLNDPPP
jgi:hypothetical protein